MQLLPAGEAILGKAPDAKYSSASGIKDPAFFISYFAPNYYDFGMNVDLNRNRGKEYLYVGAAAFVGLALLVYRRRFQGIRADHAAAENRIRPARREDGAVTEGWPILTSRFSTLGWGS